MRGCYYFSPHTHPILSPVACIAGGVEVSEDELIAVPPWNLQGVSRGPTQAAKILETTLEQYEI